MDKRGFDSSEDTGHGTSPLARTDSHLTDRNKTGTEQKENRNKSETTLQTLTTKHRQFLDVLVLFGLQSVDSCS
jgi:hypothetical protein